MESSNDNSALKEILEHLKKLDGRISKIESRLSREEFDHETEEIIEEAEKIDSSEREEELEFQIGQFWAAKVGIWVLIIGFASLLTLPFEDLPTGLPAIAGFVLSFIMLGLSRFKKETFEHLSGYLVGGGLVVLFIAVMRLHYFGIEKSIDSLPIVIALLLIVTVLTITIGIRRNSFNIAGVGITLGYAIAVLSGSPYFIFTIIALSALVLVYLKLKYEWNFLLFYGMFLAYLTHLIWFINNPFIGNTIETLKEPGSNFIFLLLYILIFSLANLLDKKDKEEDIISSGITILNCSAGFGLLFLESVITSPVAFSVYHLIASVILLGIAIAFWTKRKSMYSTFFYAMLGYSALSIAIIGQFAKPDFIIWLCWQSLLVVSTAVWFRSKFIILANFVIFLLIFLAYLLVGETVGSISMSFGIVALLSARILNWQKDRLELKTEQMRNAYLLSALLIIPYSLYEMIPSGLVSLSWIGAAVVYYILSLLLHNKKYRWMALATFMLTVIYVFVLGVTSAETSLKIISFLVLGAVLIIVSLLYSRNRLKNKQKAEIKKE
ncbi:DUF2339 domain-containing protein [bacterium BMS3Abin03]|nr:DUF2339 domain-containing protein [bacterium BMS3Abin03]